MTRQAQTDGPLVLASASPRRRELLASRGLAFEVVPPPLVEPAGAEHVGPVQRAEALAFFKARAVARLRPGAWVLGADTLVALGDRVLGKPAGPAAARRMLRALSGTRHAVITGVALLGPERRLLASRTTHVTMRPLFEADIEAYLASGEWVGKAGAYAIQETADRFVERVEGSFTNVVGLPVELVDRLLARAAQPAGAPAAQGA
jgi:septum formation protein